MNTHEAHVEYADLIERSFLGKLTGDQRDRLHGHLRQCSGCERVYERWAVAERALFPRSEAITPAARERVAERLLGPSREPARPRSWIALPVLAAALSAVLLVVWTGSPKIEEEELRPRGGATALAPDLGLRVLRAREVQGSLRISDASGGELAPGDRVKLVYSNDAGAARLISVAAVTADGTVHPLFEATAIERGADRSLGASVVVAGDWPDGPLTWIAVFGDGPPIAAGMLPADAADHAVRVVRTRLVR